MSRVPAPLADCGAPEGGQAWWLTTEDGVRIRLAHWPGPRHIILLPGRTEYIEKYGAVVRHLADAGWGAVVVDWRGQGLSDRALADPRKGDIVDFAQYQTDLDTALSAADQIAPGPKPWIVHSMGGCIGFRGLVRGLTPPAVAFSAPMLGLAQPAAQLALLRLVSALAAPFGLDRGYAPTTGPDFGLPGMGFADNNLTTDPEQFQRMKQQILDDPRLSLGGPTLRWLAAAAREMAALSAAPSPALPALFGLGSDEAIVSPNAIRERVAAWPSAELAEYPGARHELMMERAPTRTDFLSRALSLFETVL